MVTSKKTPARKTAKRAKPTATAGAPRVASVVVEAPVAAIATPAPSDKQKLVRDSFAMPKREYEQIAALKVRLLKLEHAIKKGELLRAGIHALTTMPDAELLVAVERVQRLKTGRPEKAKTEARTSTKKKG